MPSDILYNEEKDDEPLVSVTTETDNALPVETTPQSAQLLISPTIVGKYLNIEANGDVTIGDYAAGQGIFWDQSAGTLSILGGLVVDHLDIPDLVTADSFHVDTAGNTWWGSVLIGGAVAKVLKNGAATFTNIQITGVQAGSSLDSTYLTAINSAKLNLADRGWTQTCVFSVTDLNTVAWAVGTFVTSDATTYNIAANTTDVRLTAAGLASPMNARVYIYLDIGTSTTEYCCTYTATTAVGAGKCIVATAINGAVEAEFEVFGGVGGSNINASQIVTGSLTANEIAATTITSGKMNVATLSSIVADLGTITAGSITLNALLGTTVITLAEGRFNYPYTKGTVMYFNNDGYTQSGSTRTPIMTQLSVDIGTPNAYVQSVSLAGGAEDWDKDFDFNLVCKSITGANDADAFVGLHIAATTIPTTARHIGFYFDSNVLYASNADGTTQKKTDISAGLTLGNWNSYKFIFDAGTNVKFYVNDALKATHTTNLPATGTADYPAIHTVAARISANGGIYIKHTPTCVIADL